MRNSILGSGETDDALTRVCIARPTSSIAGQFLYNVQQNLNTALVALDRIPYAPTRQQLAFDAHAKAVTDLIYEMRVLTQIGYMWPTKADDRIAKMRELVSDLSRELDVLSIEGVRP